jgi:hypothetical protein
MNAPYKVARPGCRLCPFFLLWPLGLCAQWNSEVEGLRKFRIRAVEVTTQFDVEAQNDQRTNRGETIRRDYVFVEPVVGIDLRGSIYHPNLLEFHLRPEFGNSWQVMKLEPPGSVDWSDKWLQRYDARLNVLREKPYATNFFAERGRAYRDIDFFSRARVDSTRYGGHTGNTGGRLPFTFDALHLAETVTGGLGRATDIAGNTISLNVSHTVNIRHKTTFSYLLNTYDRAEEARAPTTGTAHSANLLDTLSWGVDEWISLRSAGLLNRMNSTTSHTRSVIVQENLGLQFRPNLAGDCYYDVTDQRSDNVTSRSQEARAAVRHQLYKSLTSTFTLQGGSLATHSRDTKLVHDRIGIAVAESYTKRLPARGNLSLGANWRGDRQQRQTAGQVLHIADETLTLSDRQPTFLSQANVIEVGSVTNAIGVAYAEFLDYVLIRQGNLMEIRRVPGGNIPDGAQVLVDYTATALPSDTYSTVMQYYHVRLDLFNGLVAVYSRLNLVDNVGGKSVVLRNLAERVAGGEFLWRWLTVGAERDRQNSNISPYYSKRLYQSGNFELGGGSSLTLDFEQSWTTFPDTGRTREGRSFIGRYQKQLASFLSWQLEGGLRRERGQGVDQDRKVARAAFNSTYGKLLLNLSYDFEDEDLLGELHRRQRITFRAKRTF